MTGLAGNGGERLQKAAASGSIRRKRPWSYTGSAASSGYQSNGND
jgi:hypothetical protein